MTHPSTLLTSRNRPSRTLPWVLPLGLAALLGGCIESRSLKPEFTLEVSPGNSSGSYNLSGQTNLPNPTRNKLRPNEVNTVIVQAIRTLRPSPQAKQLSNSQPIQVVVARQQATVTNGTWQTTLNLYGTNGNNQPLESWQTNQNLSLKGFEPDQQLAFVATTPPLDPNLKLATPKPEEAPIPDSPLKIDASGRYYLKAEKTSAIAPPAPNSKTSAIDRTIVKLNASGLRGESNPPRLNNANLKPQEYMR
ncbi:MAG: hypothetical protein HC860_17155 [Alkalinema sp. RU_4_3]|nr:hypothetical protein [Alkalinema sp. RU_4_3]